MDETDEIDIAVLKAINNKESLETLLPELSGEELLYRIQMLASNNHIQVSPRGKILISRRRIPHIEPECTDASCTACSSCR